MAGQEDLVCTQTPNISVFPDWAAVLQLQGVPSRVQDGISHTVRLVVFVLIQTDNDYFDRV